MHIFSACMLVFCKLFIHVSVTAGSCNEVKIESLESSSVNAFHDLTSEDVGGKPVHKSVEKFVFWNIEVYQWMFADSTINTNFAYANNEVKTIINFYALKMV